jgi:hypothetical protein
MRKLLLATAAVLSGSAAMTGTVFAQAVTAPAPTTIATPSFSTFMPSPTPGPGTITVRLNARVAAYMAAGTDSGRNPGYVTTAASSSGTTVVGANTKLANYSFGEYGRFYPGFDGIAGNGLKYGAAMEIRQDNGEAPGGGVNGSVSAATRNRATLYFRREYIYMGADQFGFVRLGEVDGPSSSFLTGTMENFNDGAWNGDMPSLFTGNTSITWPFPDVGNLYTQSKVVYLSPQFAGVDFGASFAPNTGNGSYTPGNCGYASTVASSAGIQGPIGGGGEPVGCDATSSTSVLGETARMRNYVDAAVRYRGSFGPVGVAAVLTGMYAGRVADNATPQPLSPQYNNFGLGEFGGQITYGGLGIGGNSNGQFNLQPQGTIDSLGYTFGASYAFGPYVVGASYIDYRSAGSRVGGGPSVQSPLVGNGRNEWGIAAGGTWNFAPGMNVFLSYLYGHRHQGGVDLLSGVTSSGTSSSGFVYTHNNVQAQGVEIGSAFRW